MDMVFAVAVVTALWGSSFSGRDFREEYLEQRETKAVSGIFVILVFLNHFRQYVPNAGAGGIYRVVSGCMGQLIVVPFLFYSGYGIMTAIRTSGEGYLKYFPRRRILRVWLRFAAAVCIFCAAGLLSGRHFSGLQILLSLIGYASVGNSNWYIFTVLCLYLMTFCAAKLFPQQPLRMVICLSALTVGYMAVMSRVAPIYYYDTAFAYVFGTGYALCRQKAEAFVQKSNARFICTALAVFAVFVLTYFWRTCTHMLVSYIPWCISFTLLFLFVTMKMRFSNRLLRYLGQYTFEIYILQRLPMNILEGRVQNGYLYFITCVFSTVLLAETFRRTVSKRLSAITG